MATDKGTCRFDGCTGAIKARGLCNGHYQQESKGQALRALRIRHMTPQACAADGCESRSRVNASGRPLCATHHSRWLYHGDPNKLTKDGVRPRALACIADAVAIRDRSTCWDDWATQPCWEGLDGYGGTISRGYPTIGPDKVMWYVMEADGRPRPQAPANYGLHSCDNSLCWNPAHLRWGTHEENLADFAATRNYCQHCAHCNDEA